SGSSSFTFDPAGRNGKFIASGESGSSFDEGPDHVEKAIPGRPCRTGPIVHRTLAHFEKPGRSASILAANDNCSCPAHAPQMRMKPADETDRAGTALRELEQHHAKSAVRIGDRHKFVPDIAVRNACQRSG